MAEMHDNTDWESSENAGVAGVDVAPGVSLPSAALRFSFARSGGPGGQNVNKVSSKARLCIAVIELQRAIGAFRVDRLREIAGPSKFTDGGDFVLVCEESRSQSANKAACMERLRELLVEAMRPVKKRRMTKPTYGSKLRRLDAKAKQGDKKKGRQSRGEE